MFKRGAWTKRTEGWVRSRGALWSVLIKATRGSLAQREIHGFSTLRERKARDKNEANPDTLWDTALNERRGLKKKMHDTSDLDRLVGREQTNGLKGNGIPGFKKKSP